MSLILIVEDNEKNLKLVRDVLQVKGYATIEAGTAEDGIRLAAERKPDLVLMDIQLRGRADYAKAKPRAGDAREHARTCPLRGRADYAKAKPRAGDAREHARTCP